MADLRREQGGEMGETTNIEWTDSTFNPWIGCQKVSPGCDHCYAEVCDRARFAQRGGPHWGPHAERLVLSDDNWRKPLLWDYRASLEGRRHRTFCASMADVFDNRAPAGQRERLWSLIRRTPNVDWQLLTKRPQNIAKMLPPDWGAEGWPNVWLGVTCENHEHGLPRVDILRRIPAAVRFLSCEPLLEDVADTLDLTGIHWVICGGESGLNYRALDANWIRALRARCEDAEVPFFFKQWGGKTPKANGCELDGLEIKEFPR